MLKLWLCLRAKVCELRVEAEKEHKNAYIGETDTGRWSDDRACRMFVQIQKLQRARSYTRRRLQGNAAHVLAKRQAGLAILLY